MRKRWVLLAGLGLLVLAAPRTPAAEPKRALVLHSFGREFAPGSVFASQFRTERAQQSPAPVADLPAGSLVQFRRLTFWELIAGAVALFLLQAALIIGLLYHRAKQRQGEAEATLIADISSRFVNLPASEVDGAIMEAERRLCEFFGLDISAIWQWSDEAPGFFTVTHFYSVQEGPQPPGRVKQEEFPWFLQQMLAGRIVAISALTELPAEATRDRESGRQLGIKSNLTIPLAVGGESPIGILGLNTTRAERDWPDALVKRLQLVAQVFANALARKRADQVLRDGAERYQTITTTTTDGFWEVDRAGKIVAASDECCRLYGYSREELLTKSVPDFEATRNPAETRAHIAEIMATGYARFETQHRGKDGRIIDVEVSTTYQPSSGTFLAFLRDISERRRVEVALRDLSRRLIVAHEEERARLARELHDDLTQRLAVLAIETGRLECRDTDASSIEVLRRVREGLVRLSEDVHALSYRLHPAVLVDLGLAEALKAECDHFSRREKTRVSVKLRDVPDALPQEAALCLFRVTQEALRNVARHARAGLVEVTLWRSDGGLQLSVRDDGAGFDRALQRQAPSLGLASMQERVSLLDGELDIETAPGQGTNILVWLPLGKAEG